MYFDDTSEEQKLFEDIQFKRRVQFVDDDNIIDIAVIPAPKFTEQLEATDQACQVNIQNELKSSAAQTRSKKHKEIQTENFDFDAENNSDLKRVRKIFDKRAQIVEDAILENLNTNAFQNYDVDWYGDDSGITNPFTLINKQFLKEEESQVVAVEWNSSGTTIFCGYGRFDHESVCTHKGSVATWNVDRLKMDPNKPDNLIETPCCVSSISTHPEHPAVVAVGLFNGEIHVYDTRQDDPLVATVTDKKEMHTDEITNVKWVKDPKANKKKFMLLSCSKDGRILIWNALPTKNQLKLVDGYVMLNDFLPKRNIRSLGVEMAVSSFSMNKIDKESFIAGCDSGGLFKCSFNGKNVKDLQKWEEAFPIDLKSPVEFAFDSLHGPIHSISYSPFHRNLILTCGTDSEIKLYSVLQSSCLMSFCPENGYLYSVEWSPSRPCVFACASHNGNILIYDLIEGGKDMCQITKASDSPIFALSFNQQRSEYLASGDRSGVVKIWKLSSNYTKTDSYEIKKLDEISEKPFDKS
ncbi:unnamed protein product [Brachionus calyciflorus]|uniref:Uncharacterized protein n=1 Tax=Brachionus calyciflorus TaxID=104777 RepID=A0A814LNN6_9BILA|nr:unnamed protein product [Brachionus calyciflorus]